MAEDIARGNEELIAERLLSAIKEPFDLGDNFVQVSASIGIAMYPACGTKASGLVAAAEAGSAAIAEAVIKLGKTFGLQVIAEAVKTAEQLRFVKRQACKAYHGFIYSPPVSADAMAPVLQRRPMALTI
jgi:predicted signal transduction protein with EAL and GGDEF domain